MGQVGFGFGWPFFFLIPLFWIAIFVLIFGIFGRRMRRRAFAGGYGPWGQHGSRAAEATLAERFANGDIDEKEYRARLEVLRVNNYPPSGS
jgi:putative membrane protein